MLPSAVSDSFREVAGRPRKWGGPLSFKVTLLREPHQQSEDVRAWLLEHGFRPRPYRSDMMFKWLDDEFEFWDVEFEDARLAVLFKLKFG